MKTQLLNVLKEKYIDILNSEQRPLGFDFYKNEDSHVDPEARCGRLVSIGGTCSPSRTPVVYGRKKSPEGVLLLYIHILNFVEGDSSLCIDDLL
jgi:hypothetical protein